MLNHLFSLICKESKVDADTNNISVVDIYEKVEFNIQLDEDVHLTRKTTDPIGVPYQFEVLNVFFRTDTEKRIEADTAVHVYDPKGKLLGEFQSHFALEKGMSRLRNRIRFDTIALTASGIYKFEVLLKAGNNAFKKVDEIPLEVILNIK